MIRSSKHILKFQTDFKTSQLEQIEKDVIETMQLYIDLLCAGKLPLDKFVSTILLPDTNINHSQWKACIYQEVSGMLRSQVKKAKDKRYKVYKKLYAKCKESNRYEFFTAKRFSELRLKPILSSKYFKNPVVKNFSINLKTNLFNTQFGNHFDNWVKISMPYVKEGKWAEPLKLPIKQHSQSLKFNKWNQKRSIRLLKKNDKYFLGFFYEKEAPNLRKSGSSLGIDQGYKALVTCSDGQAQGQELEQLYKRISQKKQGSKAFKKLLVHRNNEINRACNQLDLSNVKELVLEDLKYLKYKTKLSTNVMNTLQRWSYPKTMAKLESLCQTNGILVSKVDPAYTSQRCSECGHIDKGNRKGLDFLCLSCGYGSNADYNAARNIVNLGVYSLQGPEKELRCRQLWITNAH
ncbi:MAG: transposase [Candidatus Shapirobacteria bacterium]